MKTSVEFKTAWIALISLAFVVFLGKAYENTLRGIDSNIHASVSMSVTPPQQWLPKIPAPDPNPGLRGHEKPFNDHPFTFFWINGKIMRALGPSAWSSRILTATFSVGCVVLTGVLGTLLHSHLFGFLAALILLFTRDIILTGATVSLDPALMFFILLSFVFWRKGRWIEMGLTTGVGLWFKTPVVFLIYPTAFLITAFQRKRPMDLQKIAGAAFIGVILGTVFWILTGLLGTWDLVKDYWIRQLWGTVVEGRQIGGRSDFWMPFRVIRNGFIIGLPFLGVGLYSIFRKKQWKHPAFVTSATAIGIIVICLTPMRFRMDYYYNPIFPFLALISSFSIVGLLRKHEHQFYAGFSMVTLPLMAFLLCTPTVLGPEAFVALKKFIPIIQSHGHCNDELMLIPGGEPVGSNLDYSLVLKFYTQRKIWVENCESATKSIRSHPPQWMILSRENLSRCFAPTDLDHYPTRIQMGQQLLLTTFSISKSVIDLTPLERELKPVVDCKPQPYPKDIYHRNW